ncbi:proteasome adapter and scaffold protein ECM29-like [Apostichopus japonicus]|uniref:proteasome adapter and scaffold protein ECM29-like n=1 Tax=Stichopus japonicus TaxID=307972 RepID=UPI003AB64C94
MQEGEQQDDAQRWKMGSQEELELLERVFLRIGSAESDEQLENVLNRFLPPVLLKLASQNDTVRKKVLELLVHINRRLKSRPRVQLPVEALMLQYQDPSSISFVTNFTILYIKTGYPRLSSERQAELVGSLIQCLDGKPPLQQDVLLQLFIFSLPHVKYPPDVQKRRTMFGLGEKRHITQIVVEFLSDYLMLPMIIKCDDKKEENGEDGERPHSTRNAKQPPAFIIPPGMSKNLLKRLLVDNERPSTSVSEENKIGIVNFLAADVLPPEDAIIPLIIASAEPRYTICKLADQEVKKLHNEIDWNDRQIIIHMYNIFLGTVSLKDKPPPKPDDKRRPATSRVKVKIFPYLFRSKLAADMFPYNVQLVFDCMYGEFTHPKLMAVGMEFVNHMCNNASDENLKPRSPVLLNGMVKLMEGAVEPEFAELRKHAYTAVGNLVKRVPSLIQKDFSLVESYFEALTKEQGDVKLHVQEGLGLLAEAYKKIGEGFDRQLLEAILKTHITKEDRIIRYQAVRFIAAVFPGSHLNTRFILLLASDDKDEEIRKEAMWGLQGGSVDPDAKEEESEAKEERKIPTFGQFMKFLMDKIESRRTSSKVYNPGPNGMLFTAPAFKHVISYARNCLFLDAGIEINLNLDNIIPLDSKAPKLNRYISELLREKKKHGENHFMAYVNLVLELLKAQPSESVMHCLLEAVALATDTVAPALVDKLTWLKSLLQHSREEMRDNTAQVYGIVAGQCPVGKLIAIVKDLTKSSKDQNVQSQHGHILALGYTISRHYLLLKRAKEEWTLEDMEVDAAPNDEQINSLKSRACEVLVSLLNGSQESSIYAAASALGTISRFGPISIPKGKLSKQNETGGTDGQEGKGKKDGKITKAGLIEKLITLSVSSKMSNKTREQTATTLGLIPVGDANFQFTQALLEGLISTSTSREVELHFAVGHALANAVMGPLSKDARDHWTKEESTEIQVKSKDKDWILWLLKRLLSNEIQSPNPHKRQAACVWLLSVVKQCGHHPSMKPIMGDIQDGFVGMLSETDHFTQDLASKGLSIVYDQSDEEGQKELVSVLVDRIVSGKRKKHTLTAESQIFEDGALGQEPGGGNLTTYRELCSLASDLNQPDLVYKFMHLANHNALWNSRKGAAFGFGSIAVLTKEHLAPHLPQLVPRLYRYQYDPSGPVRQSMTSIWSVLVKDNKNVVDTYLKEILDDLLANMTSSLWRSRESSCRALADVIVGRNMDDVVEYLPRLWEDTFKVMDDIKESVRKAAESASKSLKKVSIKMCDLNYGNVGRQALDVVLPCLLRKGLPSTVKEVQSVSLATLVSLSKSAGSHIKPHIPLLITALLESFSGLEPQVMSYLSLHLASSQESQEKLDNVRIAATKASPMMDTINTCVQYVDVEVLTELVPRLNDLIKSGIGVGTKAGCANLVIMIVQQCPLDLEPFAGKILGSLLSGLNDKSSAVRKLNATAIGHLVKTAKDSSVEKLLKRLHSWYMEKDDSSLHLACGNAIHAMSTYNHDVLKRHAAIAMPLAFLAMHEEVKDASKADEGKESVWEDVWLDSTPGTESGIKLYLKEIVSLCEESLNHQSWSRKAQAARALKAIASKLKSNLQAPHLGSVLGVLLEGLNGRTYDGKVELLRAMTTVCISCRLSIQVDPEEGSNQPSLELIVNSLIRESKKEKILYKKEAMNCLSCIVEAYQVDKFQQVWEIALPIIQKGSEKSASDDEDGDSKTKKDSRQKLLECAFESLGKAWPTEKATQETYQEELCTLLCKCLSTTTFKVRVEIVKSLNLFVQRLNVEGSVEVLGKIVGTLIPAICDCLGIVKYSSLRSEALGLAESLKTKLKESNNQSLISSDNHRLLVKALKLEKAEAAMRERANALRLELEEWPAKN